MERQNDDYERCRECIEAFQKEVGTFRATMCQFCNYGAELHRKEVKAGDPWQSINWTDSRFKDYYKG